MPFIIACSYYVVLKYIVVVLKKDKHILLDGVIDIFCNVSNAKKGRRWKKKSDSEREMPFLEMNAFHTSTHLRWVSHQQGRREVERKRAEK